MCSTKREEVQEDLQFILKTVLSMWAAGTDLNRAGAGHTSPRPYRQESGIMSRLYSMRRPEAMLYRPMPSEVTWTGYVLQAAQVLSFGVTVMP